MSVSGYQEDELYREQLPSLCMAFKNKAKRCCTLESVKRTLPFLIWLPKYNKKYLFADIVAGVTVGLTTIPQAIAYATIAGLPPQYGLYSAFMGCFIYIFFGTCKDVTIGPTAILSLMIAPHILGNADYAILSCFLSGCIILLSSLLNLGVLVRFISMPVITGFSTAAAITIGSGQINNLFGIKSPSSEFIASWQHFFTHLDDIRRNDALLGVFTLIFLLVVRQLKDILCKQHVLIKYLTLGRNAMAVFIGILLCYLLTTDKTVPPFLVSVEITAGIPPFKLPPFSSNAVDGSYLSFMQIINDLGASLAIIPMLSILESIAVAKTFSKGKIINATQEMLALSLCNICSSFFSSMPITGSFTRTAINNASGVKTPLGGAITGGLVLMTLAFLTTTFSYIPKATLAAIIIAAMIFMIEYDRIYEIWRAKKRDILPFMVTVVVGLLWSLEYGIVCGIAFNLLFILYKSMLPKIVIAIEKINDRELVMITMHGHFDYAAAEYIKTTIFKYATSMRTEGYAPTKMIINGVNINSIDSTVGFNIWSLYEDLALLNIELICWNWHKGTAGVICRLHKDTRRMFQFTNSLAELSRITHRQSIALSDSKIVILNINSN